MASTVRGCPWTRAVVGFFVLSSWPLAAAQYQLDFDSLPLGPAPATIELGSGHRLRIQGTGGSVPTVVTPTVGTRSPPHALQNELAPGSEFGSADQDLLISLEGFTSHYIRLYAGTSDHLAGVSVTATVLAYQSVTNLVGGEWVTNLVRVTSDSYDLGEWPVSPDLPRELIVESAEGAIDTIRVSYGRVGARELIDSLLIRVWDGPTPPTPTDTHPPVVHIESRSPRTDPVRSTTVWLAGYVDEDRALADLSATASGGTVHIPLIGDPPRYYFGTPTRITNVAGPHVITVTATDIGGNTDSDSITVQYLPPDPPPPALPETLDIRGLGMEVTQAIQDWGVTGVGVPGVWHQVPLVAGKRTLVRVYGELRGMADPLPNVDCRLHGYRGAVELPGSPLHPDALVTLLPGEDQVDQRPDAAKSFNFMLPMDWTTGGEIALWADVNAWNGILEGDGLYDYHNSITESITFHERAHGLDVRLYRVRSRHQGNVRPSMDECLANLRSMRQLYPVAADRFNVTFQGTIPTDIVLPGSHEELNLGLFLGQFILSSASFLGALLDPPEHTVFLALTDSTVTHRGMTHRPFSVSVASDTPFYRIKSAHESGHALGLGHVSGCDDPAAPYETYPRSFAPDGAAYPGPSIGDWGIELDDANHFDLLDPENYGDIMSYCGSRWISQYTWGWLYDYFGTVRAASAGGGAYPAMPSVGLQGKTDVAYLGISGVITTDGSASLQPAWRQLHPPGYADEAGTGDHEIRLLDQNETVLFERHFTPTPLTDAENASFFWEVMPAPAGITAISLSQGGKELVRLKAGPNPPKVQLGNPLGGEVWPATGSREISWSGSDLDQDTLSYIVQYSADEGATWQTLAADVSETSLAIQLGDLPGSQKRCLVRVLASDGINQSQVASGLFSKATQPPTALILSPRTIRIFAEREPVTFEGIALDMEDGTLSDEQLTWSSDRAGALGNGRILSVSALSPGLHQIQLAATDSDGMVGEALVGVYITRNPDTDGDGIPNAVEQKTCTDPDNPDTDRDGILDGVEDANHNGQVDPGETDPCDPDTDKDGIPDGWEVNHKLDPLNPKDALSDRDNDGANALLEYRAGTDPNDKTSIPTPDFIDLRPIELNLPASAVTQHKISLSWTIENLGVGTAPAGWYGEVFLSRDAIWDSTDVRLSSVKRADPLASGDRDTVTQDVNLPNTPEGDYFVLVVADRYNSVTEAREANNVLVQPLPIRTPDLQPTDLSAPAVWLTQHDSEVSWVVKNVGHGEAAPSWHDEVFLSTDDVWDPSDRRLVSFNRSTTVTPGNDYGTTLNFGVPNVPAGNYNVILVADRYNSLYETSETNNQRVIPVEIRTPDLQPADLVGPPVWVTQHGAEVSFVVKNVGNGAAAPTWHDEVFLSTDDVWDTSDRRLVAFTRSTAVAVGANYGTTLSFTVPNVPAGSYYAILVTDRYNSLYEASETNNQRVIPVEIHTPDLVPRDLVVPSSFSPGETISLTWTIRNSGNGAAVGGYYDSIFLSTDQVWDSSDLRLAEVRRVDEVGARAEYTVTTTVSVPTVPTGDYFLILLVDRYNSVYEQNEANNTRWKPTGSGALADRDWGDAPPPYPTTAALGGAYHSIVPGLSLGPLIDAEPDGQPDSAARGDDLAASADEDGVGLQEPLVAGRTGKVEVRTSGAGYLDAWIDFNGNGRWDDVGERIAPSLRMTPGTNSFGFAVPATARAFSDGFTFARFRFSSIGWLPADGPAPDGEVEDYRVAIQPFPTVPLLVEALPRVSVGTDLSGDTGDENDTRVVLWNNNPGKTGHLTLTWLGPQPEPPDLPPGLLLLDGRVHVQTTDLEAGMFQILVVMDYAGLTGETSGQWSAGQTRQLRLYRRDTSTTGGGENAAWAAASCVNQPMSDLIFGPAPDSSELGKPEWLGRQGNDLEHHYVWAVLDQASEFAVGAPRLAFALRFLQFGLQSDGQLHLTVSTEAGKQYAIESAAAVGNSAWTVETIHGLGIEPNGATSFGGTGEPRTVQIQPTGQTRFYRIVNQQSP